MANFSATAMAVSGFGLISRKPLLLVGWIVISLGFSLALSIGTVATIGPQLSQLSQASTQSSSDPTAALRLLAAIGPVYLLILAAALLMYSVITVSAYRAMLHPDQGGPLYLELGAAELRQILLMFIMGLLIFALYLGLVLGVVLLGVLGGLIGRAAGNQPWIGGVLAVLGVILVLSGMLTFFVRMSLAGPASFMQNKLVVFKSWSLTKGHFWALLGGYLLNFVIVAIVYLGLAVVVVSLTFGASGFSLQALQQANAERMSSLTALLAPTQILVMIISALVSAGLYALVIAPSAYAYSALVGADAAATFE